MRTQEAIIELIEKEPLPVNKIASHLAISEGYIRTALKAMELSGLVEKVDNRLPYYYRVSVGNDISKQVKQAKRVILAPENENNDWVVKGIRKTPKANWDDMAVALEAYAKAVRELIEDGLAVDTL